MAKFYVQGVVEWVINRPYLLISVEGENGQPIAGLGEENFRLGVIGSGGGWWECKVNTVFDDAGSQGFYRIAPDPPALPGRTIPWHPPSEVDSVFTVEVERSGDRGQALAINKCCGDYGMGDR